MKSGRTKTTDSAERERFIETARDLECDEDKDRFERQLGRIARVKPAGKPAPKKPKSDQK